MSKFEELDKAAEVFKKEYGGRAVEVRTIITCLVGVMLFAPRENEEKFKFLMDSLIAQWPETMQALSAYLDVAIKEQEKEVKI